MDLDFSGVVLERTEGSEGGLSRFFQGCLGEGRERGGRDGKEGGEHLITK